MNDVIRAAKCGLQLHINGSHSYAEIVNSIIEYLGDCFHTKTDKFYTTNTNVYSTKFKWRDYTITMSVAEAGITFTNLNPVVAREGSDTKIIDTLILTFNGEAFGTHKKHHLWWFRCSFTGYSNQVFKTLFDVLTEDTNILDVES